MKALKHVMHSWSHHFSLHLTTLIVVSSCFSILFGGLVLSNNFQKMLTMWGDDLQMAVYLKEDITEQEVQNLSEQIKQIPIVGSVEFISQEKALSEFKTQMASYAPDLGKDEELMQIIPISFQVSLKHEIPVSKQVAELNRLSLIIKDMNGVEEISFGQEWLKKYAQFVDLADYLMLGLGAIILFASVFVISNVIRASISNRKREIEILELIGATARMIRAPYLLEGAILGAASAIVAVTITGLIASGLQQLLSSQLSFLRMSEHLQFASFSSVLGFVIAGSLVGYVSAYLCVRKINSGWSAARNLGANF